MTRRGFRVRTNPASRVAAERRGRFASITGFLRSSAFPPCLPPRTAHPAWRISAVPGRDPVHRERRPARSQPPDNATLARLALAAPPSSSAAVAITRAGSHASDRGRVWQRYPPCQSAIGDLLGPEPAAPSIRFRAARPHAPVQSCASPSPPLSRARGRWQRPCPPMLHYEPRPHAPVQRRGLVSCRAKRDGRETGRRADQAWRRAALRAPLHLCGARHSHRVREAAPHVQRLCRPAHAVVPPRAAETPCSYAARGTRIASAGQQATPHAQRSRSAGRAAMHQSRRAPRVHAWRNETAVRRGAMLIRHALDRL